MTNVENDVTAVIAALQKLRSDYQEALKRLDALPARGVDLDGIRKTYRESELVLEKLTLDLSQRQSYPG